MVVNIRESYLDNRTAAETKAPPPADSTGLAAVAAASSSTNQQPSSPALRGSDDSGFEEFPVIDQHYSAASGLSLVRRKQT